MLTKRDYIAIAAIIKAEHDSPVNECYECGGIALQHTTRRLADYFASDNPRFDRERFMAACNTE